MARNTFDRRFLEFMTIDTKSHGHIHRSHRDRCLAHITMAGDATHFGSNMWRVIELNMRCRAVVIDVLPLDIFATRQQGGHFFDFGLIRGNRLVARHAKSNVGNAGDGALLHVDVAIHTFHPVGQVNLVCVSDRLHGSGAATEEIPNGVKHGSMSRGKNGRALRLRRLRIILLRRR